MQEWKLGLQHGLTHAFDFSDFPVCSMLRMTSNLSEVTELLVSNLQVQISLDLFEETQWQLFDEYECS